MAQQFGDAGKACVQKDMTVADTTCVPDTETAEQQIVLTKMAALSVSMINTIRSNRHGARALALALALATKGLHTI